MQASATISHTAAERRPSWTIHTDEQPHTVSVRPARTNANRRAIAESAGWKR